MAAGAASESRAAASRRIDTGTARLINVYGGTVAGVGGNRRCGAGLFWRLEASE
jgi:hypothetical protein